MVIKNFSLLILVSFLFSLISCNNDSTSQPPEDNDPVIESVSPQYGQPGDLITISGKYFGQDRGNSYVRIGQTTCSTEDYQSWSETRIVFKVPENCDGGNLFVTVDGRESNIVNFAVPVEGNPTILSIEPNEAYPGDTITINGLDFGLSKNAGLVFINTLRVPDINIFSWTETEIKLVVPENAASGEIYIKVADKESNEVTFTMLSNSPEITDYSPDQAVVGENFTLTGKNFGVTQADGYIQFNEIKVPNENFVSWSDTEIVFVVPGGVSSGPVYVYANGEKSNLINITVNSGEPYIEDISPRNVQIGEELTIYGINFGDKQGEGYVDFSGVEPLAENYKLWQDDKIVVIVPVDVSDGEVKVYNGKSISNGYKYTIIKGIVDLALVHAGSFTMGNDNGGFWDGPAHNVVITNDYYISKTEVTQTQWEEIFGPGSNPSKHLGENNPVDQVSWFQALKFCNELSVSDGLTPCYIINSETNVEDVTIDFDADGYRLPTEAEWEYACRAGTTGDYGGSGILSEMGWSVDDGVSHTQPVAQKKANDWGIYDMHGNVLEWVWDGFDSFFYEESPETDPVNNPSADTPEIVIRGGSYLDGADKCTSASRDALGPTNRYHNVGFRVVRKK